MKRYLVMTEEEFSADDYVVEQVLRAKNGQREEALEVLRQFRSQVESGEAPDSRYFKYISECIGKFIEEEIPMQKAFNVEKPRHREKNQFERNIAYAIAVEEKIISGMGALDAIEQVAKKVYKSIEAVKKIYYENRVTAGEIIKIRSQSR